MFMLIENEEISIIFNYIHHYLQCNDKNNI